MLTGAHVKCYGAADAVIAVTAAAADLQRIAGTRADKIHVVYEAAGELTVPGEDFCIPHACTVGPPYALYVGTLQPRKNLARLISAYEQLCQGEAADFDLVLAGNAGWLSQSVRPGATERLCQSNPSAGLCGRRGSSPH